MLRHPGEHAWSDLIGVVEGEGEVRESTTLQNPVGPFPFTLQRPTYLKKRPIERACFARTPRIHAATVKTFSNSGAISP
jgi:hypothetical protein